MPRHDIGTAVLKRDAGMAKITALRRPAGASRVRAGHGSFRGAVLIPAQAPHQAAGTAPGRRHRPANVRLVMTAGAR